MAQGSHHPGAQPDGVDPKPGRRPGERGEAAQSLAAALIPLGCRVQPQGPRPAVRQRTQDTLTTRDAWLLETAGAVLLIRLLPRQR